MADVATRSAAVEAMLPDWELAAALLGGTRAMRAAGKAYLPQWPKEPDDAYAKRLGTAVLFPAYKRTVETLTGKPFSKPITVGEDVPEDFKPWLADIDSEGRNLDAFAADMMELALGYGLGGILVDYPDATQAPATAAGVRTQADEQRAGLRPYWVQIKPHQILGWMAKREGANWVIVQLRLMECVEEPDGEFGTKEVDQVRVLEPGRWRTFREKESAAGKKEWVQHAAGVTTLDFVPFVPVYGKRVGFMRGVAPLIEVAHLNVAHWQSASDQQTILHVARVPILVATNVQDGTNAQGEVIPWEMTIGASSATKINGQDASLSYCEHSGAAIGAGKDDLDALEERMRQAGAELLVIDTKMTATQVHTENAVGMCALQRITLALQDALNLALDYTAKWVRRAKGGGTVKLFMDFGAATLQEASAQLLLAANQAGKLSDETLHSEFQRRGILSADSDWQTERDRIAEQGPALGTLPDPTGGAGGTGAA